MEKKDQIPSLADLALQYGTINKRQFEQLGRLHAAKKKSGTPMDYDRLMTGQKLATGYQIGLLKLIRDYLIIKKSGEVFGKIAIEKGYARKEDIDNALILQRKEFKRAKIRKMIGDILVESGVITVKQQNEVLREQDFVEQQTEKIFSSDATERSPEKNREPKELALTAYEKQFLKVKAMDKEFAACLLEKKIATERQVRIAQKVQEEEFENETSIRFLGDIMVELNYLSESEKDDVIRDLDPDANARKDPPISVSMSRDHMAAAVELKKGGRNVKLSDIKAALADKGIRYGIYPDPVLQCNLDLGNTRFTAARPDFSRELIKQKKTRYHFDIHHIETGIKKKGAPLAEHPLAPEPYLKKDLFGRHITQPIENERLFRCGAGTRLSKDGTKVFAGKTGYPSLSIEHKLFIHPDIHVLEDADLRYGPLEPYANLSVSGILTGAYPVTAGHIKAREIRGARITAVGGVESRIGITDAVIIAQGDVKARYLHNCRIETFGNVCVETEIIDSHVYCSGKIDSGACHIISSTLYGKQGVEISGAGSRKTAPCTIGAGTEHHILTRVHQLDLEVQKIRSSLDDLQEKKEEQVLFSKKTFQKMIELKIFHDRAKKKKEKLTRDFKNKKETIEKEKLNNIARLIHNYEVRKTSSLDSLKELNDIKKKYDKEVRLLQEKIKKLKPKIKKESLKFQLDIAAFFEWARKQKNITQIKINNNAFRDTRLHGIFSSLTLEKNEKHVNVFEKKSEDNTHRLVIQKIN